MITIRLFGCALPAALYTLSFLSSYSDAMLPNVDLFCDDDLDELVEIANSLPHSLPVNSSDHEKIPKTNLKKPNYPQPHCALCDADFYSNGNLRKHFELMHLHEVKNVKDYNDNFLQCTVCGVICVSAKWLLVHKNRFNHHNQQL